MIIQSINNCPIIEKQEITIKFQLIVSHKNFSSEFTKGALSLLNLLKDTNKKKSIRLLEILSAFLEIYHQNNIENPSSNNLKKWNNQNTTTSTPSLIVESILKSFSPSFLLSFNQKKSYLQFISQFFKNISLLDLRQLLNFVFLHISNLIEILGKEKSENIETIDAHEDFETCNTISSTTSISSTFFDENISISDSSILLCFFFIVLLKIKSVVIKIEQSNSINFTHSIIYNFSSLAFSLFSLKNNFSLDYPNHELLVFSFFKTLSAYSPL